MGVADRRSTTMRHLALLAITLAACGDGGDAPDLAPLVTPDLSVAESDLSVPPLPPDLMPPLCATPQPGIYAEVVQYNYTPAAGGTAMFATSETFAIVKNDGSYMRPSSTFTSPTLFHCSFTAVDPATCMAPCCPGQTASPTMYFDRGGWVIWSGGACAFQTATGAQFIANITDVEGYFQR